MIYFIFAIMSSVGDPMVLFDFNKDSDLSDWMIVDDVVMGGRSDSYLDIDSLGRGRFHGVVSLENYGGFASTRYRPASRPLSGQTTCKIKLKGDGKDYQFRIKEYQTRTFLTYMSFRPLASGRSLRFRSWRCTPHGEAGDSIGPATRPGSSQKWLFSLVTKGMRALNC